LKPTSSIRPACSALDTIVQRFGRVDALINGAGGTTERHGECGHEVFDLPLTPSGGCSI